jgi:hypothetical protein
MQHVLCSFTSKIGRRPNFVRLVDFTLYEIPYLKKVTRFLRVGQNRISIRFLHMEFWMVLVRIFGKYAHSTGELYNVYF